jgi:hypothetical protein
LSIQGYRFTFKHLCWHSITKILRNGPRAHFPFSTILGHVRCMLSNAGLWDKHGLWVEAASAACYLINYSPNSDIDFKILEEVWTDKPVDYSNLKIFGCPAYAHVKNGKLVPRA